MSLLKNIDDCFERGLLRRVEPSGIKCIQSLRQARDWHSEAEKNLEAGASRSAVPSFTWRYFMLLGQFYFEMGFGRRAIFALASICRRM